jgi:hypothetical protein
MPKNGEQRYISTIHNHMKAVNSKVAGRSFVTLDLYGNRTLLEALNRRWAQDTFPKNQSVQRKKNTTLAYLAPLHLLAHPL